MLWLTSKDAVLAGFVAVASPALWYGLAKGRMVAVVSRQSERSGDYSAYCAYCEWVGSDKGTLALAQKDGARHVVECKGSKE